MVLYAYRCPVHGEVEVNKPMRLASRDEWCLDCFLGSATSTRAADFDLAPVIGMAPMRRIYSPPVTDCHSFGRDQYRARTPEHLRRARSEDQERTFRDVARETGARVQFGAGKSTGS